MSAEVAADVPTREAILEALESRFEVSPYSPNIWLPTEESSFAWLAVPDEFAETFVMDDDDVVGAVTPGTSFTKMFDWEWSGPPGGGCWIEIARLGEREYLQSKSDSGEEPRVIAAIPAGNDAALAGAFSLGFDAMTAPDLLTNHMPRRLPREVVFASQREACGGLEDFPADLAERIRRRAEHGDPEAPGEEWLAQASDDAIFEAWFELVYSEWDRSY